MIRRAYSPPYQARAPQLGADDIGRAVKGLVSVEVARTNEVSFAVESFGCDGRPVLSTLRGLSCESSGSLVMAGTKNGMPFRLGGELPRGIGSAIRGAGGGLRRVAKGAALRTQEWVLYDTVGNCWSLDTLTGGQPTYLGETPPNVNGDGISPDVCTQDPFIRPYELRWEYINAGGDPPVANVRYRKGGAGWIKDNQPAPVIAYPVAVPYVAPTSYYQTEQWIPDQVAAPPSGDYAGAWPGSKWFGEVAWNPESGTPEDYRDWVESSIGIIVSKYAQSDPEAVYGTRVFMNRWDRPLLEHMSIGASVDEAEFLICTERDQIHSPYSSRVALYQRSTGTLLSHLGFAPPTDTARVMFTPDKGEGWLLQTAEVTDGKITLHRFRSRAASTDAYGSALTDLMAPYTVSLPAEPAHEWGTDPVWFRVGRTTQFLSNTPRITPRLPRWR